MQVRFQPAGLLLQHIIAVLMLCRRRKRRILRMREGGGADSVFDARSSGSQWFPDQTFTVKIPTVFTILCLMHVCRKWVAVPDVCSTKDDLVSDSKELKTYRWFRDPVSRERH